MSEPNNIPMITAKLALEDIARLTKERDELKAEVLGFQVREIGIKGLTACAEKERDQLAAKCAEMRKIVMMIKKYQWSERFLERISHALSDQCGVGWLSPEQKKVLVGLIQRCDDYLAGAASFLPTRTEFKQALDECKEQSR